MYNKVIHVNKTYDANNRSVGTPKTLCSIRDVYIQPELEPICRDLLLTAKLESMAYGVRTPLLFFNRNGNHINPFSYNKYLRERSEKLIGRRITAHTLRHTHASMLLASGVNIETIARRLGHENSKVTREIYLHVTEKLTERDNDQIRQAKISAVPPKRRVFGSRPIKVSKTSRPLFQEVPMSPVIIPPTYRK